MTRWSEFTEASPRLSTFLAERMNDPSTGRLSFLATLRPDGGPRVHPVVTFVCGDRWMLFSFEGSPKAGDLQRDPRFAVHLGVTPNPFESGEGAMRGRAVRVDDPELRAAAVEAAAFAQPPGEGAILFELDLELAMATFSDPESGPTRLRWREGDAAETNVPLGPS